MQVKTLLTGLTATAALCLAGVASGDTTFDGGGNGTDWHQASNWDSGVPDANDKAIIPSGFGVVISSSSAVADSIELQAASASLTITGQTLTLDGSQDSTSNIAGKVTLSNGSSKLNITGDMTFAPYTVGGTVYGSIEGRDDDAEINLSSGVTLTNRVVVNGAMIIQPVSGTPTFVNDRVDNNGQAWNDPLSGIVRAEELVQDQGTLCLAAGLTIQDDHHIESGLTYRPSWEAESNGVLKFSNTAGTCGTNPLVGSFVLHSGSTLCLDIASNEDLHTSGNFEDPDMGGWAIASPNFTNPVTGPCLVYECNFEECADQDCP